MSFIYIVKSTYSRKCADAYFPASWLRPRSANVDVDIQILDSEGFGHANPAIGTQIHIFRCIVPAHLSWSSQLSFDVI